MTVEFGDEEAVPNGEQNAASRCAVVSPLPGADETGPPRHHRCDSIFLSLRQVRTSPRDAREELAEGVGVFNLEAAGRPLTLTAKTTQPR